MRRRRDYFFFFLAEYILFDEIEHGRYWKLILLNGFHFDDSTSYQTRIVTDVITDHQNNQLHLDCKLTIRFSLSWTKSTLSGTSQKDKFCSNFTSSFPGPLGTLVQLSLTETHVFQTGSCKIQTKHNHLVHCFYFFRQTNSFFSQPV